MLGLEVTAGWAGNGVQRQLGEFTAGLSGSQAGERAAVACRAPAKTLQKSGALATMTYTCSTVTRPGPSSRPALASVMHGVSIHNVWCDQQCSAIARERFATMSSLLCPSLNIL